MGIPRQQQVGLWMSVLSLFGMVFSGMVMAGMTGFDLESLMRFVVRGGWGILAFFVVTAYAGDFWRRRVENAVIRMNYLCCSRCGYDLRSQDLLEEDVDAVRCPECGVQHQIGGLQVFWQERFFSPFKQWEDKQP